MSRYVTSVSQELEEQCRAVMLNDNMDLSRLILHAQQEEESRLREENRDGKREKS